MRKLKLDAEKLVVESFDSVKPLEDSRGTVRGNWTDQWDCNRTNDPRLRECVTPFIECATIGWTCNFQCGVSDPLTSCC